MDRLGVGSRVRRRRRLCRSASRGVGRPNTPEDVCKRASKLGFTTAAPNLYVDSSGLLTPAAPRRPWRIPQRNNTRGAGHRLGRGGRVVNARATRQATKRVRNSRSKTSQPVTFGSRGFESYPRRQGRPAYAVLNDSPQPHVETALGLLTTKPPPMSFSDL